MKISIIIPAYNEEQYLPKTLEALSNERAEIIVIDDGSIDKTAKIAKEWGAKVLINKENLGKGESLEIGVEHSTGEIIVFLDADLGYSAIEYKKLVDCIENKNCDIAVAILGEGNSKGFGLVKGLTNMILFIKYRKIFNAPLSGQRAASNKIIKDLLPISPKFGAEIGLTIKALNKGYKIIEIPTKMNHRQTNKDIKGFLHRGKQLLNILNAIINLK